ncbi:ABC transporter ATP-binding protein, partial [Rhizobiaceae sp. 2RAB30]
VEASATAELFAAPKNDYTRALIDAVPRLTGGTRFGRSEGVA